MSHKLATTRCCFRGNDDTMYITLNIFVSSKPICQMSNVLLNFCHLMIMACMITVTRRALTHCPPPPPPPPHPPTPPPHPPTPPPHPPTPPPHPTPTPTPTQSLCNCPRMNSPYPHWWEGNISAGNGLLPWDYKPLPEPVLTKICVAKCKWLHQSTMLYRPSMLHSFVGHCVMSHLIVVTLYCSLYFNGFKELITVTHGFAAKSVLF